MRKLFPGYYAPNETEFSILWRDGIFIFDTCVLLDLYRYSDETVENLFSTMEKIKNRIWIPFQIALEYHKNLFDVIKNQANKYSESNKLLEDFKRKFQEKRNHPFLENELHLEIDKFAEKIKEQLQIKQDKISSLINRKNPIKERLADIINNSVGNPFTTEELHQIYSDGEKRFSEKIPPGYKDKAGKSGTEKYGDLIIWKEICRKMQEIDLPIIFVTSDVKEDWFQIVGEITVGPRPELIQEIKKIKDNLFYIYSTDSFLRHAKNYLSVVISDETLFEITQTIQSEVNEDDICISDDENTSFVEINNFNNRNSNLNSANANEGSKLGRGKLENDDDSI